MLKYQLIRNSRSQSIRAHVDGDQIIVSAGRMYSKKDIDTFILQNKDIFKKRIKNNLKYALCPGKKVVLCDKAYIIDIAAPIGIFDDTMRITHVSDVYDLLEKEINKYFSELFLEVCETLDLNDHFKIIVNHTKTKWASVNYVKHEFRFSMTMIWLERNTIKAIMAHEIAHLKVHDHSKNFYKHLLELWPTYYEDVAPSRSKNFCLPFIPENL